jgi:diguanylate cyclase (GGDEF)-like protein/PAS domain S-box-containing protein
MFGYPPDAVMGQPLTLLVSNRHHPANAGDRVEQGIGDLGLTGQTVGLTGRHRDGAEIPVELSLASWTVGGQQVLAGRLRDITDRRALEDQLLHQALHDPLTGLPNRALFCDRLELALARQPGHGAQQAALLMVDLDDFAVVNDGYGHAIGDQLLVAATASLTGCLGDGDVLARAGSDQFAVLMQVAGDAGAQAMARRLGAALEAPICLDGRKLPVQGCIGVVVSTASATDPQSPDELLRQAEVALAAAKHAREGPHRALHPRSAP